MIPNIASGNRNKTTNLKIKVMTDEYSLKHSYIYFTVDCDNWIKIKKNISTYILIKGLFKKFYIVKFMPI